MTLYLAILSITVLSLGHGAVGVTELRIGYVGSRNNYGAISMAMEQATSDGLLLDVNIR